MSLLTPQEARALTFRAASLVERRAWLGRTPDPGAESAERTARLGALVRTWMQAFSPGQADAFERRLGWDGLTLDELRGLVAEPRELGDSVPIASWTEWLSDILDGAPAVAREVMGTPAALRERRLFAVTPEPPFIEILAVTARAAVARLAAATPRWQAAAPTVREALERALLTEIATVSELALHQRLQAWRATSRPGDAADYEAFIRALLRGGLIEFWTTYPVAARQIATLLDTWTHTTHELLERIAADDDTLERTFGPLGRVTDLRPGLSDPHDGRRRVAILTFESGTTLVYKPRDVSLEHAWAAFLLWTQAAGLQPAQPLVPVVARDGYGWCGYAATTVFDSTEHVASYYRVAGGLVALAYVLRGRDLQMENVVATAAGPAVIDAEMFCQPTRDTDVDADGNPRPESCLASGLLTMAHVGPADAVFDIGGLRGNGVTPTSLGRRRWTGLGTLAVTYTEERVVTAATSNRVLLDGSLQDPSEFSADLASGFRDTYHFLLARRDILLAPDGPLAPFAAASTRVLFRPSQHYGSVQYALAAPAYQTSGALRSCAADTLNRVFNLDEARPILWPIVGDEQHALDALDLPRYTVEVAGTAIAGRTGPLDVACLRHSGLAGVRAILRTLSKDDLARQLQIIDDALAGGVGRRLETTLSGAPAEGRDVSRWLQGEAVALSHELLARAHRHGDALRWTRLDGIHGTWERQVLYDGALGAAVFLAAVARFTGDAATAEGASGVAADLLDLIERDAAGAAEAVGVGACTGMGSLIYGLTALEALTGDARCRRGAVSLARALGTVHAAEDTPDVTAGSAGAIFGLLALHAADGDPAWCETARRFGAGLVAAQDAAGGWRTKRRTPLAGFAHGSAGITLALARLSEATGDPSYLTAVSAGHRHERSLLVPALGTWPVRGALHAATASGYTVMNAWCHGAPGIALSRACLPDAARDAAGAAGVDADLSAALAAMEQPALAALDQICCGNLGRADILLTVGTRLDRPALTTRGVSLAAQTADRASRRQAYGLRASGVDYQVFDPGFFRGLAGIGYALLRAAHPGVLPSVLAFEPFHRAGHAGTVSRS